MTRLTAEQLEITQPEYDALIWVRDALDPTISDHDLPSWMKFDMDLWVSEGFRSDTTLSCGTACCIGGSMELHMAGMTQLDAGHLVTFEERTDALQTLHSITGKVYGSQAFSQLFFDYDADASDRVGAVKAIDRFLAGNTEDPWLVNVEGDDA